MNKNDKIIEINQNLNKNDKIHVTSFEIYSLVIDQSANFPTFSWGNPRPFDPLNPSIPTKRPPSHELILIQTALPIIYFELLYSLKLIEN